MKKTVRNGGSSPHSTDAATLYAQSFAAPAYTVPNILIAGHLTLVAGRPKAWKTWLLVQLAIAVALGRTFLGRPIVTPGRVLFLEFDDASLHLLLPKIGPDEREALKNITFIDSLKPFGQGGLADLEQRLREARRRGEPYRLLAIDPYMAVRTNRKAKDWVAHDYRELGALRQLCIKHKCTGVLSHHLRKAASPYAADQVLGTTGITAAVDAWWILIEDPKSPKHKLMEVKGRSIPETMMRIGFDAGGSNPGVYEVSEGIELKAGPEGQEILLLLKMRGPLTPAEIAVALDSLPQQCVSTSEPPSQEGASAKGRNEVCVPS